jgi:hypothetical protein
MATATTVTAAGERETLADIIYKVDSDETPIFSSIDKETSNGIFTEWQTQELAAASATNFVAEGADMSDSGVTATVRLGNYHQISQKGYIISNTLDAVDKAGRDREVAYQRVLKGLELRRDIEKAIGDTDVARASGATRKSASLTCWITNGSVGASAGAFATGDGTDTVTGGTDRALTLALIDDAMQDAWSDGGAPSIAVMSATNRANISDLTQSGTNLVTNQVNMTEGKAPTFVGSTAVYLTDFGSLDITPSRFMGNDRLFVIDPNYVCLSTLTCRNFSENDIANTGDAEKSQIVCEWALKVKAPKAHGMVLDLNGS